MRKRRMVPGAAGGVSRAVVRLKRLKKTLWRMLVEKRGVRWEGCTSREDGEELHLEDGWLLDFVESRNGLR
jgi:hypothetical protein